MKYEIEGFRIIRKGKKYIVEQDIGMAYQIPFISAKSRDCVMWILENAT